MTPYELQIEIIRGYVRFYGLRRWLGYIFRLQFTKQLLFHWWGMAIIRNWRRDERNKEFIASLKQMWPRPDAARYGARPRGPRGGTRGGGGTRRTPEGRRPWPAAASEKGFRRSGAAVVSALLPDVKVSYLSLVSLSTRGLTSTRAS